MVDKNTDPKDEAPNDTQEVEIDTQPIVDEVTTKVTKDVTEAVTKQLPKADKIASDVKTKIIDTLTGDKDKEGMTPWEKEGRAPKDYTEVAKWGKDEAKREMREETDAKEKVQAKKDKESKKAEVKKQEDWNKYKPKNWAELIKACG